MPNPTGRMSGWPIRFGNIPLPVSMRRWFTGILKRNAERFGTISEGAAPTAKRWRSFLRWHRDAREAVTHYEVLERFDGFTHVRLTLETGRTHQIRVQMAAFGHPVAGDPLYGPQKVITELQGQCLPCKKYRICSSGDRRTSGAGFGAAGIFYPLSRQTPARQ